MFKIVSLWGVLDSIRLTPYWEPQNEVASKSNNLPKLQWDGTSEPRQIDSKKLPEELLKTDLKKLNDLKGIKLGPLQKIEQLCRVKKACHVTSVQHKK